MYKSRTDLTSSLKIEFERKQVRIVLVSSSEKGHLPALPYTLEEDKGDFRRILLPSRNIYYSTDSKHFLDPKFDVGFLVSVHSTQYPMVLDGEYRSKLFLTQDHVWNYKRKSIRSGGLILDLSLMKKLTPYRREFDEHIANVYNYFSTK